MSISDTLPDTIDELRRLIDRVGERLEVIAAAIDGMPTRSVDMLADPLAAFRLAVGVGPTA